jgi:hypothetical protein
VNRADRRALERRGPKSPALSVQTYWNGEPADCRKVTLVVAEPVEMPEHWLHGTGLIGKRVKAVEVPYWQGTMYLYDEDGSGWFKVTEGFGGPYWAHRNLDPVDGTVQPQATAKGSSPQP